MTNEMQAGCDSIMDSRIGDHVTLAQEYDLQLVAGNFFYTTYTPAANEILCFYSKCLGQQWPVPAPGINDGPECKQSR